MVSLRRGCRSRFRAVLHLICLTFLWAATVSSRGFEAIALAVAKGKVVLEVSENSVAVGDWIQVTVRFQELDPGEFAGLKVPQELAIAGQSQSSSYKLINGESSSEKAFNYDVVAQKPGSVRIGPVLVTVNGQTYRSEEVTIAVAPARGSGGNAQRGSSLPQAKGLAVPHLKNGGAAQSDEQQSAVPPDASAPFDLVARLSSKRIYVGEPVYLELELSSREGAVQVQYRELRVPQLAGVTLEDAGKPQTQSVVENGIRLSKVVVLKKLTPLKPGQLKIEDIRAVADVLTPAKDRDRDGFFGSLMPQYARSTRAITAAPLGLEVVPLPEKDKPADFSGLIGDTEWTVSFQGERAAGNPVRIGDSLALTVRVSSSGDLGGIKIQPPVADGLLKVYEDAPKLEAESRSGQVFQVKEFRYAVVPVREGMAQLGGLRLSFFSPTQGKYAALEKTFAPLLIAGQSQSGTAAPGSTSQPQAEVAGGSDGPAGSAGEVKLLGNDLMPLKSQPEYFAQARVGADFLVKLTSIPLLSCLGYAILFFGSRYRERLPLLSRIRRRRGALAVALSALSKVTLQNAPTRPGGSPHYSASSREDQAALAKSVLSIVRDYLSARTGVSTSQKTSAEMRDVFGMHSNVASRETTSVLGTVAQSEDGNSIWQVLAVFEGLIFSNDVIDGHKLQEMVSAVKSGLERLERQL